MHCYVSVNFGVKSPDKMADNLFIRSTFRTSPEKKAIICPTVPLRLNTTFSFIIPLIYRLATELE